MLPFVRAAAQTGSFTAAAQELGFSQPAVSQRIRQFERELGLPLFVRTPDGVTPTQAGEVLLRHAVDALSCIESARQEIEALRDLESGHVRVVAFPSVSTNVLPLAIASLHRQHPHVTVSFQQLTPAAATATILDGTADLAVVYSYDDAEPFSDTSGASIKRQLLLVDPLYIALNRSHRLAWRTELELGDLADEDWLLGPHADQLEQAARAVGFVPRRSHSVIEYAAAQGFVGANLGISVMPGLAMLSGRHPGIVFRKLVPAMTRSVCMVARSTAAEIPAVNATMQALRAAADDLDPTRSGDSEPSVLPQRGN